MTAVPGAAALPGSAGAPEQRGRAPGPGGARAAQPRQLIVTVYGLYSRAEGGWMSVASLISLLADVGVDEPAVRSSISRLKRRAILCASRRGGVAGYELSGTALAIVREGDHRIFRRERAAVADGWILAVFSVPETQRHKRHLLRSQLSRLGFGTAAPGVWIAPAHLEGAALDMLGRLGLGGYADLFHASHLAFGDLPGKVRRWWDLDQIERLYRDFTGTHAPVLRRWNGQPPRDAPGSGGPGAQRQAFADYVRVLTDWRRLPYLDPGIPAELLPPDWIGITAADVFFTLQSRLEVTARAHVERTIAGLRSPAR